jgi:integrase
MKPPCIGVCKHKECPKGLSRKVYLETVDSRKEAEAVERRHLTTQEQIAAGEIAPETDTKRTLSAAAKEWLGSLNKNKSRSHEGYTDRMRLYILPELGTVPIARVTKSHVMRWRDDMATRFAPATVNGSLVCLASAFTYFIDRQWLDVNPCHGVAQIESLEHPYVWIQSREEITRLLIQCPGDVRDVVALALGSGLRMDELLHLQWIDIDLERRLIHVHRGKQGGAKSGKVRRVPILDCVLTMLRERLLKRAGAVLVFPGKDGKVRSQPGVRDAYKLAVKRAGLDTKLRFHDTRHTFASHFILDHGDIFSLSKILGHHSVTVTEKCYAHLRPDHWDRDYARVGFVVPREAAVYEFKRNASGQITERVLSAVA